MPTINEKTKRVIALKNSRAFNINDRLNEWGGIVSRRLSVPLDQACKHDLVDHLLDNNFIYDAGKKAYLLTIGEGGINAN